MKLFRTNSSSVYLINNRVRKTVYDVKNFFAEYRTLQKLQGTDGIIKLLDANIDEGILWFEYHEKDLLTYIQDANKYVGIKQSRTEYIKDGVDIFKNILPPLNNCHDF